MLTNSEGGRDIRIEPVLEQLTEVWRKVLEIDDVDPDDDFVELGGDSYTALQVLAWIRTNLAVTLTLSEFLDLATPRVLAAELASTAKSELPERDHVDE